MNFAIELPQITGNGLLPRSFFLLNQAPITHTVISESKIFSMTTVVYQVVARNAHASEITDLNSSVYDVLKPIPVSLSELSSDEFLASFDFAGISITGDSPSDAVLSLKAVLADTFDIFNREKLGPEPSRQLKILEKYIGKKGRK